MPRQQGQVPAALLTRFTIFNSLPHDIRLTNWGFSVSPPGLVRIYEVPVKTLKTYDDSLRGIACNSRAPAILFVNLQLCMLVLRTCLCTQPKQCWRRICPSLVRFQKGYFIHRRSLIL